MCREASDTSDAWQDLASPENVLALIEIALPVLEQQEKGDDGWIDWKGNGPTIAILGKTVEVRFQDNDTDAGPSRHFYWGSNCGNRIIAYRVIENDGREG